MEPCEVLVVGGGPTGLALGCDLLQRGIATTIVEQRDAPSTTSRAFALHARGLEILEDLGAGDVVHSATAISGVTMHAAGHPLVRVRLGGLARSGHPGAYLLSQADVEAALRDRLRELGGEVHFAHALTAASQDDDHVTARVRRAGRDHELQARWVVGCDGAHSIVRELADIPFQGGTLEESFILADLELDAQLGTLLHDGEIAAFLHDDGILGLFPLPGPRRWRLVAQASDGEPLPDERARVEATVERLLRRRTGRQDLHVDRALWWSRFRVHRRLAGRYRSGRLLIAGDAAHVHSPFGGQGMNVGLGDATNLGWKLAEVVDGRGGMRLLDSYELERRPVAEEIVGFTTSSTRFAIGDHAAGRMVRDRILPPLARARSDRPTTALAPPRFLLERFAQLGVHYRAGPLAQRTGPSARANGRISATVVSAVLPGPQPGDRAPDGPVIVHPPGTRTSLRACTRSRWALLRFGPPSQQQDDAAVAAARHLGEDVLLVRVLSSRASVVPERWLGGTPTGLTIGPAEPATAEPATAEPATPEPATAEPTTAEPATAEHIIDEHAAEPATADPATGAGSSIGEVLLEDHGTVLQRAYRPRGSETVLVRPDGHIGWRSGWPSPALDTWLEHAFGGPRHP